MAMDIFQSRLHVCSTLLSLLSIINLLSLPQETYSFSIFHPTPPVETVNNVKFLSGRLRQFQEPDEYEDESSTPSFSPSPSSQEEEEFPTTPEPELEPEQSTPASTEQPATSEAVQPQLQTGRPVFPEAAILQPAIPETGSQSQPVEPELQTSTLPPTLPPPPTPAPTPVPPLAPTTEEDGNIPLENTGALVGQILSGLINRDVIPIVAGGSSFVPAGGLRDTVQTVLYQLSPALQQILFGPSPNRRSQPENNNASSPGSPASAGGLLSIPLIPLRSPSGPQFFPPIQPARVQITQGANQRQHLQPFQQPHVINIYLEPNNGSLPVSPAESNAPVREQPEVVIQVAPPPTSPSTTTQRTTTPSTTTTTTIKPTTTPFPFSFLKIEDDVETTTLKEYIYLVLKQDEYDEFLKYTQRHKDSATASTPKPILTEDWFKTKPEVDFLYQNHYQQPDVIVSKPATPSSAASALPVTSKYRMKVMEMRTPMTEEEIANFYLTHKNRTLTYYRPKLPTIRPNENDILTQFKLGASEDDDEENVARYILKVRTYQDVLNHSSQKSLS